MNSMPVPPRTTVAGLRSLFSCFPKLLPVVLFLCLVQPAFAQWSTVETEHFKIHFGEGYEEYALRTAMIAEEVHATLTAEFGYSPREKTHIVLFDNTDLANGYANSFLFNVIGINLIYPAAGGDLDVGTEEWLRYVLIHEYTHILQTDMATDRILVVRDILGKLPLVTHPNSALPLWMLEGTAIFQESKYTSGGRAEGSIYDMYMRAAILAGAIPSLEEAAGAYTLEEWPRGTIPYLFGSRFISYLVARFGEGFIADMSWEAVNKAFVDPRPIFPELTGHTLDELWEEWLLELEEYYREEARGITAQGLTPAQQLTFHGYMVGHPKFDPAGRQLAYVAYGRLLPALRLFSLEEGKDQQLVPGYIGLTGDYSWSPDGTQLVYPKLDYYDFTEEFNDLYIFDLVTGREERLTFGERADSPSWRPGSDEITYIRRFGYKTEIWSYSLTTGTSTPMLAVDESVQVAKLSWSPQGDRLVISLWSYGSGYDLYEYDVAEKLLRPLVTGPSADLDPVWTPDGRWLVYTSDRTGVFNLYALDPKTGETWQVTNLLYGAFAPTVSPDGTNIAYVGYSAAGYDLYMSPLMPQQWVSVVMEEPTAGVLLEADTLVSRHPLPSKDLDLPIQPYNPWDSLAPKFISPTLSFTSEGIALGFVTMGMDALGDRTYYLDFLLGGPATLGLNLEYQQRLSRLPRAPIVTLQLSKLGVLAEKRMGGFYVQLGIPLCLQLLRGTDLTLGYQAQYLDFAEWDIKFKRAHATLNSTWIGGKDENIITNNLVVEGAWKEHPERSGLTLFGHYQRKIRLDQDRTLAFASEAAYSPTAEMFAVGGGYIGDVAFDLRGYPTDLFRGNKAVLITGEYRRKLMDIRRGVFDQLTGVVFVEGGNAWDVDFGGLHTAIGGELVLQTVYQYLYKSTMAVGVAVGMDASAPFEFYIRAGFSF